MNLYWFHVTDREFIVISWKEGEFIVSLRNL